MQLFICHASEDKNDFVRPLAAALKERYVVWFDEYELTMGDSLFGKINAGLASSDYGVVVLSPSFFQKKWPQAELDGLFALERTTKKMILPVWKDIDERGVIKFSPILAGRLASRASDGLPRVVEDIARAIGVAERSRELSQLDGLTVKLKALDSSLRDRKAAENKLRTSEGAAEVGAEFKQLCSALEKQLLGVAAESEILKFSAGWRAGAFEVRAPFRLRLLIEYREDYSNDATDSQIRARIYELGKVQDDGQPGEPTTFVDHKLNPFFGRSSEAIRRREENRDEAFSSEQFLALLVSEFYQQIEEKSRESRI